MANSSKAAVTVDKDGKTTQGSDTASFSSDSDWKEELFQSAWEDGQNQNYQDAIAGYTKVIELDAKYASAYNGLGDCFYELGNYQGAVKEYMKAIELGPEYAAPSYHGLGFCYERMGNYQEAIQNFTKAIKLDPKSASAYRHRSICFRGLGNYPDAIKDFILEQLLKWKIK
jgi:tetratricopeptide (TPR) repeat protein